MDALIIRYSQCVTIIQEQIFRGILEIEAYDLSDKTNKDRTELMQRIGAIPSADAFGEAVLLRNKFAHTYPEQSKEQLERLNFVIYESAYVAEAFTGIVNFVQRKNLLSANASDPQIIENTQSFAEKSDRKSHEKPV